jgi:hypothetical protein
VQQAVDFTVQAARGLDYAHRRGIIHRDVKPANLILSAEGTVKVLDLGLALLPSGQQATSTAGTVDYLAPEQASEPSRADERSDLYSLGCTLYFLLTGKPVHEGRTTLEKLLAHREKPAPSLCQVRPGVSSALDAVFQRMVAKRLEDRFQSVAEFIEALQRAAGENPSQQHSRSKSWWIAGLLVVILTGLLLYAFILRPGPTPHDSLPSHPVRDTTQDRKAAEWVLKLGGKVTVTPLGNPASVEIMASQDLPSQPFAITEINLDRTQADDGGLAHLAGLDGLEALRLNYTKVTDGGMAHLKGLRKLWLLELSFTKVGDDGMAAVGTLESLRWLALDQNPVTDNGLKHLQGCTRMESLRLNRLPVTDEGLKWLEGMSNLSLLELVSTKVTDDGLANLAKLPRLRSVVLTDTKVTEDGKAKLRAALLKESP